MQDQSEDVDKVEDCFVNMESEAKNNRMFDFMRAEPRFYRMEKFSHEDKNLKWIQARESLFPTVAKFCRFFLGVPAT